ncbi:MULTISPECIES: sensor histidine kinase [unclassified Isoptericola]|uniref:sensor histidine kinase n=1 Tax=unclassified Isoptericola TaxID=2623355 RepID=UPI0027144A4C|nr:MULTISPECIES: histidine kinase [unclassified Isoptericola]MDO8147864.1 histidine kinase [Isoptericola sp. b515]MDO8149876.1 histidine kinase [Isoptericola sp. b408]
MPAPPVDPYRYSSADRPAPGVAGPAPTAPPTAARWRRVWGEAWRLLAAFAVSMLVAGTVAWEVETGQRESTPDLLALDISVGLLCFGLVLLRRRFPTTVALLIAAASTVSVFSSGPLALAVVSLATHRRWWRIGLVGAVFVVGGWVYGVLYPVGDGMTWVFDVGSGIGAYALMIWIGAYVGLRREHLAELHERVATAEREQASRVAQARANERARIAREMHDVLAHRMSLVAMHAGALAYRSDLPPEKVAETAGLVRDSAHEALGELREVLGVLRGLDGPGAPGQAGGTPGVPVDRPERPQPTLADVADLARATGEAGTAVRVVDETDEAARLPTTTSRTAYRIVQEALTNARKHAAHMPATVLLRGGPGRGLSITVSNPTPATEPATAADIPPSGLGLLGLVERAELAGGSLTTHEADGGFTVRAWLPWSS